MACKKQAKLCKRKLEEGAGYGLPLLRFPCTFTDPFPYNFADPLESPV